MTHYTSISELESLQTSLNTSINALKAELEAQKLPELSLRSQVPHPLDEASFLPSPALYEARRTAVGKWEILCIGISPDIYIV